MFGKDSLCWVCPAFMHLLAILIFFFFFFHFRLVKSNSSVSVNVRYIPMREGLFEIQGLQILDRATDHQVYVVQDTCQLYVIA